MRALIYDAPNEVRLGEVAEPHVGPADVLVSVRATSLCGSDVHGFTGETGRRIAGNVMGHELAGVIVAVGSELSQTLVGTTVAVNPVQGCGQCADCADGIPNLCAQRTTIGVNTGTVGGLAPLLAIDIAQVYELTAPVEQGALAEPLAVSTRAWSLATAAPGEPVVIIGAGAIGLLLVQLAVADGREVLVVNRGERRRQIAESLGATAFATSEQLIAEVMQRTNGRGVLSVWDAVASSQTINDALRMARSRGSVVVVGYGKPVIEVSALELIPRERALLGSYGYTPADFADAVRFINSGRIDVSPLIELRVSLDEVADTLADLAAGRVDALRAVVLQEG